MYILIVWYLFDMYIKETFFSVTRILRVHQHFLPNAIDLGLGCPRGIHSFPPLRLFDTSGHTQPAWWPRPEHPREIMDIWILMKNGWIRPIRKSTIQLFHLTMAYISHIWSKLLDVGNSSIFIPRINGLREQWTQKAHKNLQDGPGWGFSSLAKLVYKSNNYYLWRYLQHLTTYNWGAPSCILRQKMAKAMGFPWRVPSQPSFAAKPELELLKTLKASATGGSQRAKRNARPAVGGRWAWISSKFANFYGNYVIL